MVKEKLKIVLDTNWFVSATISKKSRRSLYNLLIDKNITVFYSNKLLDEYLLVMVRPKFKKIVNQSQIQRFLKLTISHLVSVVPTTNIILSRDAKDNYLLDISIASQANYLVTGDADLLILKEINETKIVTMAQFLDIIAQS